VVSDGPYFAYYYTARYQDVIDLATKMEQHEEPTEESFWRGMASTGRHPGALAF
jgi:hypothetical protein